MLRVTNFLQRTPDDARKREEAAARCTKVIKTRVLKKQGEVYTDQEEAKDAQKNIEYFEKKGVQHFTKDGRNAEITVDLVLQARTKLSDNKVNGLEDALASEMIKICEMFPGPLYGSDGCSSSWKIVKLVFL